MTPLPESAEDVLDALLQQLGKKETYYSATTTSSVGQAYSLTGMYKESLHRYERKVEDLRAQGELEWEQRSQTFEADRQERQTPQQQTPEEQKAAEHQFIRRKLRERSPKARTGQGAQLFEMPQATDGAKIADEDELQFASDQLLNEEEQRQFQLHQQRVKATASSTEAASHRARPQMRTSAAAALTLAVASGDGAAHIVGLVRGEEEARFEHDSHVNAVEWCPIGWHRRIATAAGNGHLSIFDVGQRHAKAHLDLGDEVHALSWSADGTFISAACGAHSVVNLSTSMRTEASRLEHPAMVFSLAWEPKHGRSLATGAGDGAARVFNMASRREEAKFVLSASAILDVSWHVEGAHLLVAGRDHIARVVDVAIGVVRAQCEHGAAVNAAAWQPRAGAVIATASDDGFVRLFDLASGRHRVQEFDLGGQVRSIAWSPDGTKFATGGSDGIVRVFDTRACAQEAAWEHGRFVYSVAWQP